MIPHSRSAPATARRSRRRQRSAPEETGLAWAVGRENRPRRGSLSQSAQYGIHLAVDGRATGALGEALAQAEEQVKTLTTDIAAMESASEHVFTPPPKAWIADRIRKLNDVLVQRTESSALALRRLTGPVMLTPEKPEVGRAFFRVRCWTRLVPWGSPGRREFAGHGRDMVVDRVGHSRGACVHLPPRRRSEGLVPRARLFWPRFLATPPKVAK